jgi:hypothetical protein
MLGTYELPLLNDEIMAARQLVAEYKFELENIPVTISIRLYQRIVEGDIEVRQSHYIRTPLMSHPHIPETSRYSNLDDAVLEAIKGFTVLYNAALQQGFSPNESWLVPNDLFSD